MAKNDQEEALDKVLTANLARIVDFVKFAEAKNGALATISSGWLIAIATLLSSGRPVPISLKSAMLYATPFLVIAGILAVVSFLPKVNLSSFTRLHSTKHKPNLLFFGDIAALGYDEYEEAVRKRYLAPNNRTITEDYLADLSVQIAVVSRIAMTKLRLFQCAMGCAVIAFMILSITITLAFFRS
jgi:hypothetical protein